MRIHAGLKSLAGNPASQNAQYEHSIENFSPLQKTSNRNYKIYTIPYERHTHHAQLSGWQDTEPFFAVHTNPASVCPSLVVHKGLKWTHIPFRTSIAARCPFPTLRPSQAWHCHRPTITIHSHKARWCKSVAQSSLRNTRLIMPSAMHHLVTGFFTPLQGSLFQKTSLVHGHLRHTFSAALSQQTRITTKRSYCSAVTKTYRKKPPTLDCPQLYVKGF